jgi:hypothetical protein
MRHRKSLGRAAALVSLVIVAWLFLKSSPLDAQRDAKPARAESSLVFTPAHRSLLEAVRDFFGLRPKPVQPIAYSHKVHLENAMACLDCHTGVESGPMAGIPGVETCMVCHSAIATDHPEIQKLAAFQGRGEDVPWQRVYDYSPSAHVRFEHAPHIRAGVDCARCHGDMTRQTVAVRAVNLTMGTCVTCHQQGKASVDCTTCHF